MQIKIFLMKSDSILTLQRHRMRSEDERRSHGFGTTWGWVINYIIFIFGWTIPLRPGLVKGSEGSQMLFYVWFEFTSWLRGVGQGKGAWDCFLTIWAWDNCAFCQWDQWLLRDWTFILQMTLSWPDVDSLGLLPSALMFCLNLKKVPPPILTIKIPCKNDLRWDLRWLQITTHVIE